MNPDTGEFSTLEALKDRFMVETPEETAKQLRRLGWMELAVNEVVKIKGHDFRVCSIGKTVITLESVKVVDPSTKNPFAPKKEVAND